MEVILSNKQYISVYLFQPNKDKKALKSENTLDPTCLSFLPSTLQTGVSRNSYVLL